MNKKVVRSFLLCLLAGAILSACGGPGVEAEIGDYVADLAARDVFSGVVLVARGDEVILKEAYGLANRSFEVPNQVDTKFNLGSMNKMFTAVAILQLAEQGKLSLDDRIVDHLPDYPNQAVAGRVTIHHLLTHTSGMGDFFTDAFFATSKTRFRDIADYLPLFVDAELQFEPGAQFSYSNAGFMVLGLIVEAAAGQSYFDYVREHIYEPCGMANTDAYEQDDVVPNLAVGYTREGAGRGEFKNNAYTGVLMKGSPAGGGYSTVEDLFRFSRALLNHELLSPESTGTLLGGKVSMGKDTTYAYGFVDRTVEGHRVVGHGGGAPGISSNLDIYLDLGYTVVVLTNTDQGAMLVSGAIRSTLLK
jgi:D-alanyl-D-alanine carboxypeptidase